MQVALHQMRTDRDGAIDCACTAAPPARIDAGPRPWRRRPTELMQRRALAAQPDVIDAASRAPGVLGR